jgi:hypothetical protein
LAAAGVNVKVVYGATEFGAPAALQLIPGKEKLWEWMEFSPKTNIRWVEEGAGKYECQFLVSNLRCTREGFETDNLISGIR